MMGGWDYSHHVDPWSLEDGIVRGLHVKDTELRDEVEWIRTDWKLDCARGTCVTPRSRGYGDITATYMRRSKIPSHVCVCVKHQYR